MDKDQQHTNTDDASRTVDRASTSVGSTGLEADAGSERPTETPSLATKPETDSKGKGSRKKVRLVRRDGPGRPIRITRRGYALIEAAAAEGVSKRTIAARLGVDAGTFNDILRRDPRAQDALDLGTAANETELRDLLMTKAREGNVTAAIYLTKARHGWTEGEAPERRPTVVINLPDAQTPEQYLKTIRSMKVIPHDGDE